MNLHATSAQDLALPEHLRGGSRELDPVVEDEVPEEVGDPSLVTFR
jgi:hypothetical protein